MKNRLPLVLVFFIVLGGVKNISCQVFDIEPLSLQIFNSNTKAPIEGVHVFFVNSTYGGTSASDGKIQLRRPRHFKQDLIFTHIGFETKIIPFSKYVKSQALDSVLMTPHRIDLDAVVVEGSRNRIWKKRYKRFKKAFLGSEKAASKCSITNPEVLEFVEEEGELIAKANGLLNISNDHLGYDVNFHLESFVLSKNESLQYRGQAKFTDRPDSHSKKRLENRKKAFESSSKYFYLALINDRLEAQGFSMSLVKYHGGNFIEYLQPSREEIISFDSTKGHYLVSFAEFLQVTNRNINEIMFTDVPGVSSGLESRRFNSPKGSESGRRIPATSQIYKVSESIILDRYGNILNPESVREYGFWAKKRMATMLPFDYGWVQKESNDIVDTVNEFHDKDIIGDRKQKLFKLIYGDQGQKRAALKYIGSNWSPELFPPLMDLLRMTSDEYLFGDILYVLQQHGGEENIPNYFEGLKWLWKQEPLYNEDYLDIKGEIYQHVDPSFKKYFSNRNDREIIRLDEIVWGGVKRDGIPPLRSPKMITVQEADYLNDEDVVFALYIDGEAKAYPKRILAWHEFFQDIIGGVEIAGVYCTLCGTVIAYDRNYGDEIFDLGTSGFLYRSNKLMYDKATYSLWSTIEGRPVLGPLSEKDIELTTHPVITTTWGTWSQLHPHTKVLSLDTGFDRNYNEGVAYKDYFETDALMFPVPLQDYRLKNKQEVMVVRVPGYEKDPVAFSFDHLKKRKVVNENINGHEVVILFDDMGGARAFSSQNVAFKSYKKGILRDAEGNTWTVTEKEIKNDKGERLSRLPSHNIFWFAWFNAYPNTRLIK